jgi:hypothetical protein
VAATTCPVASASAQAPEQLPFELPFSSDGGGIAGTGFTLRQEPGGALLPDLLTLDTAAGVLRIGTTPGIAIRAQDSQDNALGVTLSADQRAMILETVLLLPPSGTSRFEQAGIWYGTSQDDYVKLVVVSRNGTHVHMLHEGGGAIRMSFYGPVLADSPAAITLRLRIDRASGDVTGAYELPGQPAAAIGTWTLPTKLMISGPGGGTSSGGIFATHRLGPAQLTYTFDRFGVRCARDACAAGTAPSDPTMGDGTPPVGVPGEGDVDPPASNPPAGTAPRPAKPPARTAPGGSGTSVAATPSARHSLSLTTRRRITLRRLRRHGLSAWVRCSEECAAGVKLLARRSGGQRVVRLPHRGGGTAAAVQRRVTLRLASGALRRLRGVGRLQVRARARFADGSTAEVRRTVRLRR